MQSAQSKLGKEIADRTNEFYGKLEAVSLEGEIYKIEGHNRLARKAFQNALEFSGIALFVLIIFLIIFEASLVAFDPLIDNLSQGEVAMKVLFNSGLAFAVFTAHHFLEGRMNSMIRKR